MILAALMLAAAAPAAAEPATSTASAGSASATTSVIQDPKEKNDPMVCRKDKAIGSLLVARRTCMRRSEWAAQREANRLEIERAQLEHATKH